MSDQYEILSSYANQEPKFNVRTKKYHRLSDSNNTNYPAGQINFNALSDLTSHNEFFAAKESQFEIPFEHTGTSDQPYGTDAQSVFMLGVKNSFLDHFSGISVKFNEINIINDYALSNLNIQFKILSSWSLDDVNTKGDIINFRKNDADTYTYNGAATPNGNGECNNTLIPTVFDPLTGFIQTKANSGFVERMKKTSLSAADVEIAKYQTIDNIYSSNKCRREYNSSTSITYKMIAILPLTFLHDFFDKLPLIRNASFSFVLHMHTCTTLIDYTHAGTKMAVQSVNSQNGYNPIMVSKASEGITGTADATFKIVSKIGFDNQKVCYFNACVYEFTSAFEDKYLEKMGNSTLVTYNNVFQNSILLKNASQINWTIHTGMSKCRSLLIIVKNGVNGTADPAATGNELFSINDSPFTSGDCMYGSSFTNVNVIVGLTPLYRDATDYSYDLYQHEIKSSQSALNGGLVAGMSSGLISQNDYESGKFSYLYFDLSRGEKSADDMVKGITFKAKNNSKVKDLQLYAYLEYENQIVVNVDTGMIVN